LIPANDILQRRDEIKNNLAQAQWELALKLFIDFTQAFYPDYEIEAIVISSEYYDMEKEVRLGVKDSSDLRKEKNSITVRILKTLSTATLKLPTYE